MIETMRESTVKSKRGPLGATAGVAAAVLMSLSALTSCSDGVDNAYLPDNVNSASSIAESIMWADAIVTVKSSQSGSTYFQLDEKNTLEPYKWTNPFRTEVRALLSFSDTKMSSDMFSKLVTVNRIDSLLTKEANYVDINDGLDIPPSDAQVFIVDVGYETTSELLNNSDPVEIVSSNGTPDWLTFSEDGYLTIHFATYWGGVATHSVNLYASKSHPDHLYFVHKNNGDLQTSWGEGLVAFKLFHMYLGRKDEFLSPREVTLHWMSFDGEQEAVFKYGRRVDNK